MLLGRFVVKKFPNSSSSSRSSITIFLKEEELEGKSGDRSITRGIMAQLGTTYSSSSTIHPHAYRGVWLTVTRTFFLVICRRMKANKLATSK